MQDSKEVKNGLLLSVNGELYRSAPNNSEPIQKHFVCRALPDIYRKLFRYTELKGLSALSVLLMAMSRMNDRGADEYQVGVILGIGECSALGEFHPRPRLTLAELVDELV